MTFSVEEILLLPGKILIVIAEKEVDMKDKKENLHRFILDPNASDEEIQKFVDEIKKTVEEAEKNKKADVDEKRKDTPEELSEE